MKEMFMPIVQDFLVLVATGVLTLLGGFLVACAKKGFDWLSAKINCISNEDARQELSQATEFLEKTVYDTVSSLQQTLAKDIRESIASGDGVFTKEDLCALKNRAAETVKRQLSTSLMTTLETVYDDLDDHILDLVESYLRQIKKEDASVGVEHIQTAMGVLVEPEESTTTTTRKSTLLG